MDWMTEEWANTVYEEAWDEAEKAGAVPEPFVAIYIARAAVRKAVEWVNTHAMKGIIEDLGNNWHGEKLIALKESEWNEVEQEVGL